MSTDVNMWQLLHLEALIVHLNEVVVAGMSLFAPFRNYCSSVQGSYFILTSFLHFETKQQNNFLSQKKQLSPTFRYNNW